jgi:hypothetical protein
MMKKQTPDTESSNTLHMQRKKNRISVLQIILTIYGLLYLIFIIDNFIPHDNFNPYDLENIIVKLAFIFFLAGYFISWKNKLVAGIIFIIWWVIMWYLAIFIAEHDKGGGVGMGLPLFILSILFIVSWYRAKNRKKTAAVTEPGNSYPEQ